VAVWLVTSKRAPLVVTALRSFLRYLFHRGIVAIDLAMCVPTIATWSLSHVPRFLAGDRIKHAYRDGIVHCYRALLPLG
jgi:hypothetical protein